MSPISSALLWSLSIYLLYFITDLQAETSEYHHHSERRKIAVCVSGQISRYLPESTIPFLIQANSHYDYTFFVNLQFHLSNHSYVYSTDPHIAFHPTKFVSMNHMEVIRYLHRLYSIGNYCQLGSVRFVPPKTLQEWEEKIFRRKADRISQYANMQHVILNSYYHQHACYHQIVQYEESHALSFDYVIQTREDIVYFSPFNLSFLIHQLKAPISSSHSSSNHSDQLPPQQPETTTLPFPSTSLGKCDFISKWCLTWGGINMRWQIMTRNASSYILGKRLAFYQQLYRDQRVIYNPEQYELAQIKYYGVELCQFDVDIIPNIVARHMVNDEVCFMRPETIDNCIPPLNKSYVQGRLCHRMNNKHLRVKIDQP